MSKERPLVFDCDADQLVGIFHEGRSDAIQGVVIVVGGPQYRVGSHRQFVIMARNFASAGIPVLRFDYRGMGDSGGTMRTFEHIRSDIRAAVDCLVKEQQSIKQVVLLGLCDAASAILMCAPSDDRITKLIVMNPWVYTEAGEAKVYIRNYYLHRLLQRTFWKKLLSGKFEFKRAAGDAIGVFKTLHAESPGDAGRVHQDESYIDEMRTGLGAFGGDVLAVISGRDLTAAQFMQLLKTDENWQQLRDRSNFQLAEFPLADHTMSRHHDLNSACDHMVEWLGNN